MKKLLYLLVGILLAAFILPSCNSALSITKRKYTKGYYVHHNAGKKRAASAEQVSKSAAAAKTDIMEVRATEIARQVSLKQEQPAAPQKMVTAAASKKHEARANTKEEKANAIELAVKKPVKAVQLATKLARSADAGDDALSLLWVVIVVILIVYLLGILMDGFGLPSGLIHVLGVIALVLLILWLLRIL